MGAFNVINRAAMAAGQPENVGDVLANFDALATLLNGNVDDFNIKAAAAIARSKLNLTAALIQPGDFAAGSKITTSTWAGGPPVTPADQDIWIATGVDATGTRWSFQYAAASGSHKWEAFGSSSLQVAQANLNTVVNTAVALPSSYFYVANLMSWTAARAGDYRLHGVVTAFANGDATMGDASINAHSNGALIGGLGMSTSRESAAVNGSYPITFDMTLTGVLAGTVIGIAGLTPNNAVWKFGSVQFAIDPKRIS